MAFFGGFMAVLWRFCGGFMAFFGGSWRFWRFLAVLAVFGGFAAVL